MKRFGTLIVCLAVAFRLTAAANMGTDSINAEWMREWYQLGDLRHYLDNYCDVTTYQMETTGGWATPEPLLFSINGNSYRWNKYYLNGFRTDSRIQAGDALYEPDMFSHSMQIDYNRGAVFWQTDSVRKAQISLSGQAGNIGSFRCNCANTRSAQHRQMWCILSVSTTTPSPSISVPITDGADNCVTTMTV